MNRRLIQLNGSNKKLVHQSAYLLVKANIAAEKGNRSLFESLNNRAQEKLSLVAEKLGINKEFLVAPDRTYNSLIVQA